MKKIEITISKDAVRSYSLTHLKIYLNEELEKIVLSLIKDMSIDKNEMEETKIHIFTDKDSSDPKLAQGWKDGFYPNPFISIDLRPTA